MLWSRLDCDITQDPEYVALEELQPGSFWLFVHCLRFARLTNIDGRILNRARIIDAVSLARAAHRSTEDCQNFLDLATSLGILERDESGYLIADWARWHLPKSDTPEAMRERKQRERAKKLESLRVEEDVTDVTRDTVTKRDSCARGGAEQSRAEQSTSRAEQSSGIPPLPPTGGAAAVDGYGPVLRTLLELQPGSTGSEKFRQAVAGWYGSRAEPRARHPDYLTAAVYAVAEVRHQWSAGKSVTNALAYALSIAQNHLTPATERRLGNEARAKQGFSVLPYVWEPPKEEKQSA